MDKLFRRIRFSVSVSALITLVIGLSLTAILFASIRQVESERQSNQFLQNAKLCSVAVSEGLHDAVEQLMVLNQLFRSMGVVSREQFKSFTAPLLQRYPQIQALSFQRLVMQSDRQAYEARMRQCLPNFRLSEVLGGEQKPAGIRDSYNVIEYIEPSATNEQLLGIDTAITADQTQARLRSRSTGLAAATSLLPVIQHKTWHTGFMLMVPVYMQGAPLDTAASRNRAVIGETAAILRVDHLIDSILGSRGFLAMPGLVISIYAGPGNDPQYLAFQHHAAAKTIAETASKTVIETVAGARPSTDSNFSLLPRWLFYDRATTVTDNFTLGGNPWHIEIAKTPVLFTANNNGSFYVLLGGILFSLLAAAYVYSLVSRKAIIEKVTSERTAALQFANLRLCEDLALRKRTEKSLRLREKVIEVSSNAIIICSADAPNYAIEYVNPAFEHVSGYAAADVVGRSLESLQGSGQDQQNIEEIRTALREQREGHALLRNHRKDGSGYWSDLFVAPVRDDSGTISHFVVAQYDISSVMRFEAELAFQAKHDSLTGLANRNLLRERLTQAISNADRNNNKDDDGNTNSNAIWVVFVDIDRFNFVNDTLGHEAGDELLKTLAGRLQSAVREADTVARLGGDEFVLVLPEQTDDGNGNSNGNSNGLAVLQQIMDAIAQPLMLSDYEFFLTCSIGIATYPLDGVTAEGLIKHADIAMYRAKEMGRNSYQFYTPAMNERTLDRLSIEADLRHALERNEFVIHYQPQINLSNGRIVGMEALLRWNHPAHGMIAPTRFIGLAEEMGLILPIGAWVIRTACIDTKTWQDAGFAHLRVAVNLSARQFTQKMLVQSISDILEATGLDASYLELELTESMVMSDVESAIAILRNLKSLGIHISIDDFGTGYSSLSYLRRFPIDVLKIDQSFVNDITVDTDDAAIVASIISLAHSLRLKVIAEGVETTEQLDYLRAHGCDQVQGYLFSRAVAADAFEKLLESERSLLQTTE
ncbi:diguanylate cyclase (GGDEF)-like protein/PAS domain S-box-containing protein [Undibacterium sp. GrIS 1.8]|uniref:bifunctional diguanylate cyclase/phosphodiesterase n=1 Tax=unclassified Undibacterium TaxID=2630295 RepID=UPI00339A3F19